MDRHKVLNGKQRDNENLEHFWHALKGLAANCHFGTQTTGLVNDIFVSNMKNTLVQERLITVPKDNPQEALNFAIAFEQGAQQRKTIRVKTTNLKKTVFAVEKNKECYKCGEKPFTMGRQKTCETRNVEFRNCGKTGHYACMYLLRQPETKQNKTNTRQKVNGVPPKSL